MTGTGQSVNGSFVVGDVVLVRNVAGDVTITTRQPPYRVAPFATTALLLSVEAARAQPARLLQPRYAAVPFAGRELVLSEISSWLRAGAAFSVRLVHATGGQGKTRLAGHVAAGCAAEGWAVWHLHHNPTPSVVSQADMPTREGVLAVVDYADRWPVSHLLTLLTDLNGLCVQTGAVVRVLLLARSMGSWWPTVADRADSEFNADITHSDLKPLGEQIDPATLFDTARRHFATRLDVPDAEDLRFSVNGERENLVLAIHMAALTGVDARRLGADVPVGTHQVSSYLLRREYAHWKLLHGRVEDPIPTSEATMRRVVYLATLTGAQPRELAKQTLVNAGVTPAERTDEAIDDHATCYPPSAVTTVLEPLHPDRLGEDFLALIDPRTPHRDLPWLWDDWTIGAPGRLLAEDPAGRPPAWTPAVLATLVETAHRWPHVATGVLYPLVRERPELAITAGGAVLTRLVELDDVDLGALAAIDAVLPAERRVDLDVAAAAVSTALLPVRLAENHDAAARAKVLINHSSRVANAGQYQQATRAGEEAVDLCRRLVVIDPDRHLPELAASLNNLSNSLAEVGRHDESFRAAEEALALCRRLAEKDAGTHLLNLAKSLGVLGVRHAQSGHLERALALAEEATALHRRLVTSDPKMLPADLAMSLNNLGNSLMRLGRYDESLVPHKEAVDIRRRLAKTDPAGYLPNLATSLVNLGSSLANLGRDEESFPATAEAVDIYRQLVEINPAAYLPNLAASLTNLSNNLLRRDHHDEAVNSAEESVGIYRRLAETNPAAYLPNLAASLTNLGPCLAQVSRHREALAAVTRAVDLHRQFAKTSPTVHQPNLAMSLWLHARLSVEGGAVSPETFASINEAITLSGSAGRSPHGFPHPDALSNTLVAVLDALGRFSEAARVRRWIDQMKHVEPDAATRRSPRG